jgi:hypothetical protein
MTNQPSADPVARATGDRLQIFRDFLGEAGKALSVSPESIPALLRADTDDWTLVIKCHAVVETAMNAILEHTITPPKAGPWLVEALSFTRRVDLCDECGVLEPGAVKAVKALSKIRNAIVHDTSGFDFTFSRYLHDDPEGKHEATVRLLAHIFEAENVEAQTLANPRFTVWAIPVNVTRLLLKKMGEVKLAKKAEALNAEALKLVEGA